MYGQGGTTSSEACSHQDSILRDEFKVLEKAYRRISPRGGGEIDSLWDELVDIRQVDDSARVRRFHVHEASSSGNNGLIAYEIEGAADGLYVIPNALTLPVIFRLSFYSSSFCAREQANLEDYPRSNSSGLRWPLRSSQELNTQIY
jgi:hypothetical protein